MPVAAPVYVKNNQPGPTVLASDPAGTHQVEWAGSGDPMGGDVQIVPEALLSTPAFMRNMAKGVFSVVEEESDPEVSEALAKQVEAWRARTSGMQARAAEVIEREVNNDFVEMPCIGPDPRGGGKCGEPVSVRDREKYARPVLCSKHKDLEPEYVPSETQEGDKTVVHWLRPVMSAPQRQD